MLAKGIIHLLTSFSSCSLSVSPQFQVVNTSHLLLHLLAPVEALALHGTEHAEHVPTHTHIWSCYK